MSKQFDFLRDTKGGLSVEFILCTMFLVFMQLTMVVLIDLFLAMNRSSKANMMLANISARFPVIFNAQFNGMENLYNNISENESPRSWMRLSILENFSGPMEVKCSRSTRGAGHALENGDARIEAWVPNVNAGQQTFLLETNTLYVPFIDIGFFHDVWFYDYSTYRSRAAINVEIDGHCNS